MNLKFIIRQQKKLCIGRVCKWGLCSLSIEYTSSILTVIRERVWFTSCLIEHLQYLFTWSWEMQFFFPPDLKVTICYSTPYMTQHIKVNIRLGYTPTPLEILIPPCDVPQGDIAEKEGKKIFCTSALEENLSWQLKMTQALFLENTSFSIFKSQKWTDGV